MFRATWIVLLLGLPFGKFALAQTRPAPADYASRGVGVGRELPNILVKDFSGNVQSLDAICSSPTLLLTSSFTCPKSRTHFPIAHDLAQKYAKDLRVLVIYVIEAHPVIDPSPYKGIEDLTEQNRQENILRRQPTTFEQRLGLAEEFKTRLGVESEIYVDTMDNAAWKALGGGPNMGLLVDDGIVRFKQGWFDGPEMDKAIAAYLAERKKQMDKPRISVIDPLTSDGPERWAMEEILNKGEMDKARALLEKYPYLPREIRTEAFRGDDGHRTLLQVAVAGGHAPVVELVLSSGADVNAQCDQSPSALHQAAAAGNVEMVKLLLAHKADVNLPALRGGRTPLDEAVFTGNKDVTDALLAAGAREDFFTAAGMGKIEALNAALKDDAAIVYQSDGTSGSALDYAAANNQLQAAKLLLTAGARVDGVGDLPIHWATRRKNLEMVQLLLENKSDINASTYYEGSPLCIATRAGDLPMMKLLVKRGADLDARQISGWAPIHIAAYMDNQPEVMKLLLDAGARTSSATSADRGPCAPFGPPDAYTPLHLVASAGNVECVKILLAYHADPNAKDVRGRTPIHLAVDRARDSVSVQTIAVLDALMAAGGDVNAADLEGRTPLDLAIQTSKVVPDDNSVPASNVAIMDYLKSRGAHTGNPKAE